MIKRTREHDMKRQGLYIKGKWLAGYGPELVSKDPYTLEEIWRARTASPSDISRAVYGAKDAFPAWRETPAKVRIDLAMAYEEALRKNRDVLAEAIAKEVGKPLWEAKTEVQAMIGKVQISIDAYKQRTPDRKTKLKDTVLRTNHRPHGPVVVLGPYNFPGHLPNGHIVPALIAGNTVIFKPSEKTPLVGEALVKCWEVAGLPPGVLNLVQGDSTVGKTLTKHEEVQGVFFTGSYQGGKALTIQFAETPGKILALEMGGNNPLVVSRTGDMDKACETIVNSAYLTTGQRCTGARRLIVLREMEEIVDRLVEKMGKIVIGHYKESPEPFMGPMIDQSAAVKVMLSQASLEAHGGHPIVHCELIKENTGLITPGLMDVTGIFDRPDEEIFGPFLQVIYVSTFQEAIEEANRTNYGLSAALISDSKEEWEAFYNTIRAGVINRNRPTTGASSKAPFGGVGKSGNHRPSAYYAADYCAYPVASME